jgi:hypothetical protein
MLFSPSMPGAIVPPAYRPETVYPGQTGFATEEVLMPLGTRDLLIIEGDLVKVTSHKRTHKHVIPPGTIATIQKILPGTEATYQLNGYENLYLNGWEMELVSYTRKS